MYIENTEKQKNGFHRLEKISIEYSQLQNSTVKANKEWKSENHVPEITNMMYMDVECFFGLWILSWFHIMLFLTGFGIHAISFALIGVQNL